MNKQLVHAAFEDNASLFPERIAVEEESRSMSYGDLNKAANRLAHCLLRFGYQPETIIGSLLPPGISLVQSMLAVFKCGYVYLPMDIHFPRKRFDEILTNTPCKTIITTEAYREKLKELLPDLDSMVDHFIILEQGDVDPAQDENPVVTIAPDAGLYIIYTSGSTGEGKAILGCQKGLDHFIRWEIKEFELDATCRVSQLSQVTFDSCFRDMLVPLTAGGTLCIPASQTKENALRLIEWIERTGITLIHCVPSLYRMLIKELIQRQRTPPLFPSLRYILMAGESLFSKDIRSWYDAVGEHVEIVNLYGTSETTLAKTFHRIREIPPDPSQALHVGKPIDNTFIAIVNEDKLCRIGEIGEIYIQTAYRTRGYYNNPGWNEAAFVQNPLIHDKVDIVHKTGDFGRYLKDRSIEYLGRLDDQVKVNGIRVELNEIKKAVLCIPGIGEVEITALKNNDNEVGLVCYYTGREMGEKEMRDFLKGYLNENILPSFFIRLQEFPLNINGKIDRKRLPKPDLQVISSADYIQPVNETEQGLERIWKDVLSLRQISREVSFFRIGGNSLRAMQVISRIFHEYKVSVTIGDVFLNPTIAGLAVIITAAREQQLADIVAVTPQPYYDVSHGQQRIWLLAKMEKDLSAYNVPAAFMLDGLPDVPALQKALDAVLQRHESLRTTFHYVDGMVKQQIRNPAEAACRMEVADWRALPDRYTRAREAGDENASASFNLETGPLFTIRLLRLETDKYLLLLNMHHIISDYWSLKVLIRDLFTLYGAFTDGMDNPLPPLPIHYKDFSDWHSRYLQGNSPTSEKQYWMQRFAGNIPVLNLPADFKRPGHKTYAGSFLRTEIDQELSSALRHFARDNDVTLFMLLLAAVKLLLYNYTGETDIVIGTPVAGRVKKILEDQIGLYINILPLRTRLDPGADFIQLLHRIKQTTVEAYDHQLYPFDLLVEELKIPQDRSHSPLFDVMVVLQDSATQGSSFDTIGHLRITDYATGLKGSKYDLEFNFFEERDSITLFLHYNSDLFMPVRMEVLRERLMLLLSTILEQPGDSLVKIAGRSELALKTQDDTDLSWNLAL